MQEADDTKRDQFTHEICSDFLSFSRKCRERCNNLYLKKIRFQLNFHHDTVGDSLNFRVDLISDSTFTEPPQGGGNLATLQFDSVGRVKIASTKGNRGPKTDACHAE